MSKRRAVPETSQQMVAQVDAAAYEVLLSTIP